MKGLIIAAGYGTRFLPVTKTIPKEMLPINSRPSISYIIEEFIASGITDIVLLTSRRKSSMDDYFDHEIELESLFLREGRQDKLDLIKPYDIHLTTVRQRSMQGTGHALLEARSAIGDQPFVAAYPDDLHIGKIPLAQQLISVYEQTGCSVLAAMHDPPELNRYGILSLDEDRLHVNGIVEKPAPGTEPSREASIGRFLYTPEIFDLLQEGWEQHTGGEYYHVYALQKLMDQKQVVYCPFEGERLDTGSPEGYLRTILRFARRDPALLAVLEEELRSMQ